MPARRAEEIEYAIRDVILPARELEKKGIEVLKLNIGDPVAYDFDTPKHLKEALYDATLEGLNGYTESEGLLELRVAIAERERKKNKISLSSNDIVVTTGVTESIQMLFGALLEPGDEVLVPGPSYPPYISLASFFEATPIEYRTIEEEGWIPDLEDLRKKISQRCKAVVVINPNNPTGALYPKKILKEICGLAGEYNLPLISDEIYDEIVFKEKHTSPSFSDIPMIIFNGLSKVFIAPGWRIGWAIFYNFGDFDSIKQAYLKMARLRLSSNSVCQKASVAALKGSRDHVEDMVKKLKKRRDFSHKRLNEISGISCTLPKGAFYIFPKISWEDKKFALDLLLKEHVLFVHGSGFSKRYGRNHLRAVFLPPLELLEEAFYRLERFVGGLRR
ncbi:MAG: aminotransferase class I/II-fold pyridoxal phosphate-dependent enzyme [Candidatus Methanofastidiosia archaeon]